MNCGLGPTQMATLLPQLTAAASIPVLLSPNAGMPLMQGNRTYYNVGPSEFATAMARLAPQLHVAGGCCGTTPEHIAALTAACRSVRPTPPAPKHRTLVTSFAQAVEIGGQTGPVLVGERINPTGKPRLKQALHDGDMDYLYRMALDQTAAGAQVLDVNVGVPGTNEPALLTRAITGIQAVCGAPLQVDTANPDAAAAALRLYNGKPLFNSVDGRPEHLATILPLVQRYGACLVALALDEQGVPETWQGRFKVAERIIAAAEAAGIPRSNVVVDALTMTVSTDVSNARTTLAALKHIHDELGVCTVLGVSNVSFGLPRRSLLNASFLLMALESGLNAAIVNPQDPAIRAALAAHRTLSAQDEACINYIAFATTLDSTGATSVPVLDTPIQESMASKVGLQPFNDHVSGLDDTTGTPQPLNAASSSLAAPSPLHRAVVQGLRESAARAATELLAAPGASPLAVINEHLIPALDDVGAAFGAKRLYLPQLLASAEAAKSAFEVIKRHLAAHGAAGTPRGKVVLATVQGDVHDIGKNIVKVLLENYNFQVIDLGKNVDPELVLQQARDNNVSLVGLSALMTTSLPAMERTIGLLHEQLPGCHIMVGGAVLTANYAAQIGADFYGKDALASVRYAESLMPEL
jgi:5-methyltetrahydrofolate--homocysteine methyltransferase